MIIKYIKNTKRHREGQVIKGDFKILIKAVKRKEAVVSNEYEYNQFIEKLKADHAKKEKKRGKSPLQKVQVPQQPIKAKPEEECLTCKEKAKKRKSK